MSCYVEYDRIKRGRKSIALCGDFVDECDISGDPDCPECRRELAKTADEVFGTDAPGAPAHHTPFNPLQGYRPRSAR